MPTRPSGLKLNVNCNKTVSAGQVPFFIKKLSEVNSYCVLCKVKAKKAKKKHSNAVDVSSFSSSLEPLISLDLVSMELYRFRVHCYYCVCCAHHFLSQSRETF